MSDVLEQARTPSEQEITAAANAHHLDIDDEDIAAAVLDFAAPRILALAYREAARKVRDNALISGSIGPLMNVGWSTCQQACANMLEALATALEEGTPV